MYFTTPVLLASMRNPSVVRDRRVQIRNSLLQFDRDKIWRAVRSMAFDRALGLEI
jgi:hypothetical protein